MLRPMEIHLFGLVYLAALVLLVAAAIFLMVSGRRGPVTAGAGLELLLVVSETLIRLVLPRLMDEGYLTVLDVWVPLAFLLHAAALVLIAVGVRRSWGPRELAR